MRTLDPLRFLPSSRPYSDPDIQHLPFFAISPVFLKSLWSSYYKREMTFDAASKFLISLQHKLFYIVLSLARFNLYANSYGYLAKTAFEPRRYRGGRWWWWAEVFGLGLFSSSGPPGLAKSGRPLLSYISGTQRPFRNSQHRPGLVRTGSQSESSILGLGLFSFSC